MIQVSNEFKTAIKKHERKIKGYVEVLYDLPSVEVTATTLINSTYTDIEEIVNGKRVSNNYGTLDYLPLDGSILTMDTTDNVNSGFISDARATEIDDYYFKINLSFSETTTKGITIYYEDNYPTMTDYTLSDNTTGYLVGNSEIQQIIFDTPKTITSIQLQYNKDYWVYTNRKIRINQIDLGITQVYKDQDLIEFTVDEEVNKLVEEVPINETSITLNNMSDLFNPLNPTGIVPYLSENTFIKPYIGVLTENLGVEYVKMGEFYFDSYTNNSDSTTTLVGKNIINQIQLESLKDDNETNIFWPIINSTIFRNFLNNYNYDFEELNITRNSPLIYFKDNNLLKILTDIAFYQDDLIYANRNNQLYLKNLDSSIKDNLTKSELINDVEYKKIDKINTIKLIKPKITINYGNTRTVLQETVKLTNTSQVFLLQSQGVDLTEATIEQTGGESASIISQGAYMVFVKVEGNIGSDVTIKLNSSLTSNESRFEQELTNRGSNKEVSLTFDSPVNVSANASNGYIANSNILNRTPSYEMKFEYNGDPSLEAGDYINVETPYGYKKLFIQKNRFKFDGGLEGSIEGVE